MVSGIVFFDIDGTLVPGTSSGQFLAARLGNAELPAAEARYAKGIATNREVEAIDAAAWEGVTVRQIHDWLLDLPVIAGIEAVVGWCARKQLLPVLATLAWQPVSESLSSRFGFRAIGGPRVQSEAGVYTGQVAEHFDEYGKRDRALALAATLQLPSSRCVAVGDSRSDHPLFEAVGFSVALNADSRTQRAASASLDTDDLRDVLPILQRWIEQ
jgi:phosphoserine phosphatase